MNDATFKLCAGTSIQWGAWTGVGMAADTAAIARIARSGMGVISPSKGLQVLQSILSDSQSLQPVVGSRNALRI